MTIRVDVVGGSLVGATAALFQQQQGIETHVWEAAPKTVTRSGGVIGLEYTALHELEQAGIPQSEIVHIPNQTVLSIALAGDAEISRQTCTYPGRTTTWNLLHKATTDRLAPDTYHQGHKLNGITVDHAGGREKARLHFTNGHTTLSDVVVFADGRNSWGRTHFDPDRKLRYAGYVAHRGQHPDCPPELAREFVRTKVLGSSFSTFPIRDGEGVAVDWTFYLNETPALFESHYKRPPEELTFVFPKYMRGPARDFVHDAARRLLPDHERDIVLGTKDLYAAPIFDIDPPSRMVWPVGSSRVILLGGALGPLHPATAREANAGIEQAADLAAVLHQHAHWGADLDSAFDRLAERQIPPVRCALREGPILGASMGLGTPYGLMFDPPRA